MPSGTNQRLSQSVQQQVQLVRALMLHIVVSCNNYVHMREVDAIARLSPVVCCYICSVLAVTYVLQAWAKELAEQVDHIDVSTVLL